MVEDFLEGLDFFGAGADSVEIFSTYRALSFNSVFWPEADHESIKSVEVFQHLKSLKF